MRRLASAALFTLAAGSAFAGAPERDQAWDALIAEAKKHGGRETQYKNSVSCVFHRSAGGFLTFTRMLDSSTRAVCVLDETQIVTVCGNWDTAKMRYGWRTDPAAAWTYSDTPPADPSKNLFSSMLTLFHNLVGSPLRLRRRSVLD